MASLCTPAQALGILNNWPPYWIGWGFVIFTCALGRDLFTAWARRSPHHAWWTLCVLLVVCWWIKP